MRALGMCCGVLLVVACGGVTEGVDTTVATIVPVRGDTRVGDERAPEVARAAAGDGVHTGERALARLVLDVGPQLLLDGETELAVVDEAAVELRGGRVFVEAGPGEQLEFRSAHGSLRCADASMSAEVRDGALRVYVVRGEVSWTQGEQRGVAAAGEELTLGGEVRVRAAALWHDWTGGLARPGPAGDGGPEGVGMLEARVPDEVGLARWPLVVRRLDVRIRIERDLAITEVDQLFFNPASETVEGLYRIRVPEGAVLQRFAVDRDGRLVDGFVRERAQARQAYEQQVYRGSTEDPALLEWDAPGSYRARIYPIGPGATRRIVIRYAEWLHAPAEGAPRLYRYPMGGGVRAPHIQELSITADVAESGAERIRAGMGAAVERGAVRIRRSDFRPRADFWMELVGGQGHVQRAWVAAHEPPPRAPDAPAMPNEADERDYFFLPLVLPADLSPADSAQGVDLVIVADVSAATDRSQLELGRSVAESFASHLDERDRVAIVSSDLRIRSVVEGPPALVEATRENVERLLDGLARTPAGGATDLGQAIVEAAALLDPARRGAIVYVGDGAPTVGELRADGLLERVARLPNPVRFYAVAVGSDANLELLEALARGGGLALRVEERSQAAGAAMRILAHAERPVAHQVEVLLGNGIENAFPRRAMDAVVGEVFPVVGRVRGELPSTVTVKGVIGGQPFEREIAIEVQSTEETTDLRLRWAAERLRQLLLDGAGREEVAELGTRYGLITPFTSYYVPSRNELARMGAHARLHLDRPLLPVGAGTSAGDAFAQGILALVLGPLAIAGCTNSDEAPSIAPGAPTEAFEAEQAESAEGASGLADWSQSAPQARVLEPQEAQSATEEVPAPSAARPPFPRQFGAIGAAPPAPPPARDVAAADDGIGDMEEDDWNAADSDATGAAPEAAMPVVAPLPDFEPEPDGATTFGGGGFGRGAGDGAATLGSGRRERATSARRRAPTHASDARAGAHGADVYGALSREVVERVVRQHLGQVRFCYESGLTRHPDLAGIVTTAFVIDSTGAVQSAGIATSTLGDTQVEQCIARAVRRWMFPPPPGGGVVAVRYPFMLGSTGAERSPGSLVNAEPEDHTVRRCSDAADLPLDDRRALWRERLSNRTSPSDWVAAYDAAIRDCEARTWRDRCAFLALVLERAGTVRAMLDVYRLLDAPSARSFVRSAVLRRVRTPEELREVRAALGLGSEVDWTLVDQILARAQTEAARIRALRRLSWQYPDSIELKLRLLAALERAGRNDEAKRFADHMRADPLVDAGARTAIGEMFLRMRLEDEARRVFSEIVEFAPLDELARRRLGDLYRAHGWYDDAYRQYQTLAEIRPDDPSVKLLLAQAAAGAGRVDEALRLERGLMQTAKPGESAGIARAALLWSSVRFARLRKAARDAGDEARLEALTRRMRRSGILREAGQLRVTLVWSHPDAQLSLWAGRPGMSRTRPADIMPEYGLEAFHVEEQELGTYTLAVHRTADEDGELTPVTAELVVIWNEGEDDEQIEIVDLTFDRTRSSYRWTLNGRALTAMPLGDGR